MSDTKFRPKAEWKISGDESGHINYRAVSNELVIAWALDKVTREPRYILELSEQERGAKCNCICASCELDFPQ